MGGGFFFTLANVGAQIISLLRMVMLARLVSLEDFGTAATYLLIVTLIDMLSQFGLPQMIVQDRNGDEESVQRTLQAMQLVRGLGGALLLLVAAWPLASVFGQTAHIQVYLWLAVIPLLGGFVHFDQHRLKREMQFVPASLIVFLPYLASLVIMLGLSLVILDHSLMLYAIIGQQVVSVGLSHWLARRPYGWNWDVSLFKQISAFGAPLFLNSLLLFGIMNGERIIVGHALGMAQLAIFTMMLNLSMTPTLVLSNSLQTWLLPQLSRVQDLPDDFKRLASAAIQATLALGLAVAVGAALAGPPLAAFVAGDKYRGGLVLFVWLAMGQGLRLAKVGAGIVALARGYSGNQLAGNALRVATLPLGWFWVSRGGDLVVLAWLAIGAEALSFGITLRLAAKRTHIPLRPFVMPIGICLLCLVMVGIDQWEFPAQPNLFEHLHLFQLTYLMCALAALWSMRDLARFVRNTSK